MITIKMGGELADYFIPKFECEASSTWEAIQAIKANFPGFLKYLADSAARGIAFHIKVGYQSITEDLIGRPFAKKVKSFTITPIPVGSGGGIFKLVAGIALIGLAFSGIGLLGLSPLTLGLTGGAMLLSGISSLFGKVDAPKDDGKKSIVFNNPETTVKEGSRCPVIFGCHLGGMVVVSARVRSYKL